MRILYLLIALLFLGPVHAEGIYKCVLEGRTVYTNTPCSSDEPPMEFPPINHEAPMPAPSSKELARRYDQRIAQGKLSRDRADKLAARQAQGEKRLADRRNAAIAAHRAIKGMSAEDVKAALGEPDRIEASGLWLYHRDGKRITVRFAGKVVSQVQTKVDKLRSRKSQ